MRCDLSEIPEHVTLVPPGATKSAAKDRPYRGSAYCWIADCLLLVVIVPASTGLPMMYPGLPDLEIGEFDEPLYSINFKTIPLQRKSQTLKQSRRN